MLVDNVLPVMCNSAHTNFNFGGRRIFNLPNIVENELGGADLSDVA